MTRTVLLVFQSPKRQGLFINVLPPVGILSIASYLASKGVPVAVKDCSIAPLKDEDVRKADIIGFSINISNIENSLNSIRRISRIWPDKKIVVGGPSPMSSPEQFMRQEGIQAVAVGEGEETLFELAQGNPLDEVAGLYVKSEEGRIHCTGQRQFISDLDQLPFPALDKIDLSRYYSPIKKALPISNLITSRGCPYGCIYCFKTMGKQWRARSAQNVVDEIEWQVRNLGVKEICIYDDNFTMDVQRTEEICDEIMRRKIKVRLQLTNGIRVDRVTHNTVKKLKAAGVWILGVAPESGNAETLQRVEKGFNLKKVTEVVRWCKEEGVYTYSFFMLGFPWECRAHVEDTIRYAARLDTELTQFSRVTAFPGTKLYDILFSEGAIRETAMTDQGLFCGGASHALKGLSDGDLRKLIKRAYRKAYLHPGKWLRLLKMLSLRDLWNLFRYSIKTGSI